MAPEKDNSLSESDWERRVLCSDESCIGVIGPDGRCKECGLAYEGDLPRPAGAGTPVEASDDETGAFVEDTEELVEDPGDGGEAGWEAADAEDDWDRRVLCSDESCIGVIGPDGRCKECGKPFQED